MEKSGKKMYEDIVELSKTCKKVTVNLDRDNFKKNLSTEVGYGYQDLKKEYKKVIEKLIPSYDIEFLPLGETEDNFGIKLVIKKAKIKDSK